VAITMIDLLPDAALTPLTWLFAGSLLGRAEGLIRAGHRLRHGNRPVAVGQIPEGRAAVGTSNARIQLPSDNMH
jgi:hypothetical protein